MVAKKNLKERDQVKHLQLINHIGNVRLDYCLGCDKIDPHF
jgi:hypothetical protein